MQLKTSKGKEYEIEWVDNLPNGGVFLQMLDSRPLAMIAEEFDGLSWLERFDEDQGDKRFEGYNTLALVKRETGGAVLLKIDKEA